MNRKLLVLSALAWLGVLAWGGTIYYLSTKTGSEVEHLLPMKIWDKAAHFIAFTAGGFLIATALRVTAAWSWRALIPVTFLVVSLYGATDEWHQQYTPGRSGKDVGDWTADTIGGLAGGLLCFACGFRRGRGRMGDTGLKMPSGGSCKWRGCGSGVIAAKFSERADRPDAPTWRGNVLTKVRFAEGGAACQNSSLR